MNKEQTVISIKLCEKWKDKRENEINNHVEVDPEILVMDPDGKETGDCSSEAKNVIFYLLNLIRVRVFHLLLEGVQQKHATFAGAFKETTTPPLLAPFQCDFDSINCSVTSPFLVIPPASFFSLLVGVQ